MSIPDSSAAPSPIARLVAAKVGFTSGVAGFAPFADNRRRSQLHLEHDPAHDSAVAAATAQLQLAQRLPRSTVPALRLVQEPTDAVVSENHHAAAMPAADARWALALKVADTLEGGSLAMLRPERRRQLLTQARRVGLRDFDTNLVIAIVQDAAREGQPMNAAAVVSRVGLIRPVHEALTDARGVDEGVDNKRLASRASLDASRRWLVAVFTLALASAALSLLIRWLTAA